MTATEHAVHLARVAAAAAADKLGTDIVAFDVSERLAITDIFLIVTASTFPVVLPFILIGEVGMAKAVSQAIALAMLFFGGLALGRFAGYGSWRAGLLMAGLGTVLVAAIRALGG